MAPINNSGNYDLLSSINNTNENNTNSVNTANSIDYLEDTLDKQFGANIIGNNGSGNNGSGNNGSGNNGSGNNGSGNNSQNISINIQDNTILSSNTSNKSIDINNRLTNNINDFVIYDNGVPLTEFDNSNKSTTTNVNQHIIKSPNRKLSNNNNVNSNVKFADPIKNINNISNNINTNISNNNNNSNNISKILPDGLLETSTNDLLQDQYLEDYFYLDDNKNINNNLFETDIKNLKDIDISKTNTNANGTKVDDNFVLNFPARMSDGRQFTDYKSNGFLNIHEEEVKTTLEYRLYLQKNAENIMDNNYNIVASINDCSNCPGYQIVNTKSLLTCSKESCIQELKDDSGLGFDIQYVAV